MVLLLSKYVYFNNLNLDPVSGVGEDITDTVSVTVDLGSEIKNNSMRIKLKNDPVDVFSDGTIRHNWVDSSGNARFKALKATRGQIIDEEIINVFAEHTETDPTINVESNDFLLFIGVVNKGAVPFKERSHMIELTCKDRSIIILDKLTIPQAYRPVDSSAPGGVGWRSSTIIQNITRNGTETDRAGSKFDDSGNIVSNGKYLIDSRLFSDFVVSSGTTTTTTTRKLIDSGATFQSNDIEKDDWVRNTSTNAYAFVISIDSQTQITLSKDIFAGSTEGYQISDGFIQDLRSDGTSFPVTSFSQLNKPVNEGIQSLSSTKKINTVAELTSTLVQSRSMRWFIDTRNRLHWYAPSNTPELIMEVGQTAAISPDTQNHTIYDVAPETFVEDNINFIIFKAGEDMNGLQIKSFSRAPFSGTPNVKDSLREWPRIARQMKWEDTQAGNITKIDFDDYAFPVSFPVTPAWDRQARSVANDGAYNANFKEEAILRGKELAKREFQMRANPRWKGKILLRGERINVGDLIQFTSKPHGINNILIRTTQVTHSITSATGWLVTINFEEDEQELTVVT